MKNINNTLDKTFKEMFAPCVSGVFLLTLSFVGLSCSSPKPAATPPTICSMPSSTIAVGLAGGVPFPTGTFELAKGGAVKLVANVTTVDANKTVTWTSDSSKATVVDGVVTGVEAGTDITITAKSNANLLVTKEVKISVIDADYKNVSSGDAKKDNYLTDLKSEGGTENIAYSGGTYPSANSHEYVTTTKLKVKKGESFTLKVKQSVGVSVIWIDWNIDGYFYSKKLAEDATGEYVALAGTPDKYAENNGVEIATASISVPAFARVGKTRIRILTRDAYTLPPSVLDYTYKGAVYNGSIKDFDIEITE